MFNTYSNEDDHHCNKDVDPMWPLLSTSGEAGGGVLELYPVEWRTPWAWVSSIACMGHGQTWAWRRWACASSTVTDGNVVHQDSRIQVNDLLMEMDGMNLVGVTQLVAHALEHQGLHAVYADWPGGQVRWPS